jgi:hypothetical protein
LPISINLELSTVLLILDTIVLILMLSTFNIFLSQYVNFKMY